MILEREESTKNPANTPEADLGTNIRKRGQKHAQEVEIDTDTGLGVGRDHAPNLGAGLDLEKSVNTRLSVQCRVSIHTILY